MADIVTKVAVQQIVPPAVPFGENSKPLSFVSACQLRERVKVLGYLCRDVGRHPRDGYERIRIAVAVGVHRSNDPSEDFVRCLERLDIEIPEHFIFVPEKPKFVNARLMPGREQIQEEPRKEAPDQFNEPCYLAENVAFSILKCERGALRFGERNHRLEIRSGRCPKRTP